MSQSNSRRRTPMRVAIAALGVALVAMAALIAFLIWGRPAPTMTPSPSPSASATVSATATASAPQVTLPAPSSEPTPEPTAAPTAAATTSAPPASTTATTTTAPSPSSPSSAPQTMMWEGKATFKHFTVEVVRDDPGQSDTMIEGKAGLLVEVCLTVDVDGSGAARISSDPWTLEDSDGNVQRPQKGGYEPAFPTGADYPVGKCVRGFLTFDYVSTESDYANLVYENGLGDRAVWQFH